MALPHRTRHQQRRLLREGLFALVLCSAAVAGCAEPPPPPSEPGAGTATASAFEVEVGEELRRRVERLREYGEIVAAGERIVAHPRLLELYEGRGFSPVWVAQREVDELLAALRGAESHGLDPRHYHLEALTAPAAPASGGASPAERAVERDLLLSDALLRLAGDLRFGRVEPADREPQPDLSAPPESAVPGVAPETLIASDDLGRALEELAPDHFAYRGLRRALARYRETRDAGGIPRLREGEELRRGDVDPRVPPLRRSLAATGDLPAGADLASPTFDAELEDGLRRFQFRHGLNDDGVMGTATYTALTTPAEVRIDQIRVNLERARWISVYLHDTPARTLFERDQRAFSHGCIRVQDPLRLAELVLDDPERWTRKALAAAVATGATRTVHLERPLPVLVLYWTAAADLDGELHFYRDVYGRDEPLLRALDAP